MNKLLSTVAVCAILAASAAYAADTSVPAAPMSGGTENAAPAPSDANQAPAMSDTTSSMPKKHHKKHMHHHHHKKSSNMSSGNMSDTNTSNMSNTSNAAQ